jgi:hypothetical protein
MQLTRPRIASRPCLLDIVPVGFEKDFLNQRSTTTSDRPTAYSIWRHSVLFPPAPLSSLFVRAIVNPYMVAMDPALPATLRKRYPIPALTLSVVVLGHDRDGFPN